MAGSQPTTPNFFQLHSHGIRVTYSTNGLRGKPTFSYHDANGARDFSGEQINVVKTPIGDLVTVVIHISPDSGSTSFSILVPAINLANPHDSAPVTTEGITTLHRFSIIPALLRGQIESYHVVTLTGSAQLVIF